MIYPMALLVHDVHPALKLMILLMAEQQQHLAVGVTLYLIKNAFDTPFLVLT
jgi:hypothetical protein